MQALVDGEQGGVGEDREGRDQHGDGEDRLDVVQVDGSHQQEAEPALLGTMLGELFASQRGLGFLLMTAIDLHDVKTILAIAVLISAFAILANAALLAIDKRLHRGAAPDSEKT